MYSSFLPGYLNTFVLLSRFCYVPSKHICLFYGSTIPQFYNSTCVDMRMDILTLYAHCINVNQRNLSIYKEVVCAICLIVDRQNEYKCVYNANDSIIKRFVIRAPFKMSPKYSPNILNLYTFLSISLCPTSNKK